jgi:hypothetical protein
MQSVHVDNILLNASQLRPTVVRCMMHDAKSRTHTGNTRIGRNLYTHINTVYVRYFLAGKTSIYCIVMYGVLLRYIRCMHGIFRQGNH